MKWHHLGGLIGGVFLCTWIFSGWLSVNPFKWFSRTQLTETQLAAYAGWTPGTQINAGGGAFDAVRGMSDISFLWVGGKPLMLARSAADTRLIDVASGARASLTDGELTAAAGRMYPAQRVVSAERIERDALLVFAPP